MRIQERLCWIALVVWTGFGTSQAFGAAYQVQARTEAQAYQLRSYRGTDPENPVLLPRRLIVQYLGANGYELVTGRDVGFESSLRVFADLGLPRGEAERLDGMATENLDLLYANIFYRTERFEARLGRQVYIDLMDIMAFDGLRLRYVYPLGAKVGRFGAEAYAGLWVKGANMFASSVYQLDGTRESDDRRLARAVPGADPMLDDMEPVVGVKVLGEQVAGLGLSTSLGYRRSTLGGQVTSERTALELVYGKGKGLNGWGGVDYDLVSGSLVQARAQVRYDQPLYAASVEALRFAPVYTTDSIFYYFAMAPRDELRVRGDYLPAGPLRYYASVLRSMNDTRINSSLLLAEVVDSDQVPGGGQLGASVGAAARFTQTRAALDLTWRAGFGGQQLWADLTGGYVSSNERYSLDARLSVASIDDDFNPLLRGIFYGMQLWGSYRVSPVSRLSAVLAENINPYTQSDTQVFLLFDVRADL